MEHRATNTSCSLVPAVIYCRRLKCVVVVVAHRCSSICSAFGPCVCVCVFSTKIHPNFVRHHFPICENIYPAIFTGSFLHRRRMPKCNHFHLRATLLLFERSNVQSHKGIECIANKQPWVNILFYYSKYYLKMPRIRKTREMNAVFGGTVNTYCLRAKRFVDVTNKPKTYYWNENVIIMHECERVSWIFGGFYLF